MKPQSTRWLAALDLAIEEWLPGLLIALIAVGITVGVFARYVFHAPIAGIPELATNAMIWIVFVGAAAVSRRGLHVALDILTQPLPARLKAGVAVLASVCTSVILLVFIVWSWRYIGSTHRVLPMTGIPIRYAWFALPLGGGLMLLHELIAMARAVQGLRRGDFEHRSESFEDQFATHHEFEIEP